MTTEGFLYPILCLLKEHFRVDALWHTWTWVYRRNVWPIFWRIKMFEESIPRIQKSWSFNYFGRYNIAEWISAKPRILYHWIHRQGKRVQTKQSQSRCQRSSLIKDYLFAFFNPFKPIVTLVNREEPGQTTQNAASDQVLHCLLTDCSLKILMKIKKNHQNTLKMEMGWSNW